MRRTVFLCAFAAMLVAGHALAYAAEPRRLVIAPPDATLVSADARAQFLASLEMTDGSWRDVTTEAKYDLAGPTIARIAAGVVTPLADGTAVIRITYAPPAAPPISAEARVTVRAAFEPRPLNFAHDIVPVLSKYGCNAGACHGKLAGQRGFRLSLFGCDPAADYDSIVKEARGRRVFPAAADRSLLLTKPSGQQPHGGGIRLAPDSPAYQLVRRWIAEGMPNGVAAAVPLTKITTSPRERVLAPQSRQTLRVVATFADGSERDVTADVEYRSQNADVLRVDMAGLVSSLSCGGEGTVLVRYQGLVDIARFSVPFARDVPAEAFAEFQPANLIDEPVLKKWRTLGIAPSKLSSDEEFARRVFLDTIGAAPTPTEIRQFLADPRGDKRARLIDALLGRPEFNDYWALQLGDLLQNRRERDHDVRGVKGVRGFHLWLRRQVAVNRPWNELARDVLTAAGDSQSQPAVGYFTYTVGENREAQNSEVVASVAQSFLGTRILCAKCHNHPTERTTQDDYYHFAAYFSRLQLGRQEPEKGPTTLRVGSERTAQLQRDLDAALGKPEQAQRVEELRKQIAEEARKPIGATQARTGKFMAPQPLDRSTIPLEAGVDPRVKLADWICSPNNEAFSGAMVNRLWRHFMGVGLVEPVDDLRATNPPSNEELWRALKREFVAGNFDLRRLMGTILNSRTYQLSSTTTPRNSRDTRYYSHYYARRLPAEVLLDALSQATGVSENFAGYPGGTRAVQLPDPGMPSYFLGLFGRSERVTACACERRGEVTIPQLLHLQNGDSVPGKIRAAQGRLAELLVANKPTEAIVEELFLATLARPPRADEQSLVAGMIAAGDKRDDVLADLFWALLNSKEFAFNH